MDAKDWLVAAEPGLPAPVFAEPLLTFERANYPDIS